MNTNLYKARGFSLVELAVVVGILGIALIGTFSNLGEFRTTAKQAETEQNLKKIKEQLIKFARINKYLPCPDTNSTVDGRENRGNANTCSRDWGTVPYLDIGMKKNQVEDAYGNLIRYAVNSQTTDVSLMCQDVTSSASYFCNDLPGAGQAFFSLTETAPLAVDPVTGNQNDGVGNYIVCNHNNADCSGNTDLSTSSASVVLVAYGQGECSSTTAAQENCDTDQRYHQAKITSEEGKEFDDLIEYITGYEIKAEILGPVVFWTSSGLQGIPPPTFRDYSLEDGEYAPDTGGQDVIVVDQNITDDLVLGAGDDYVIVGNDLTSGREYDNSEENSILDEGSQATIDAGTGNDTIFINGDAYSDVDLGPGKDIFILGGNLAANLSAGDGNDEVWLQGNQTEGYDVVISDPVSLGNRTIWERNSRFVPELGEYTVTDYSTSGNTITKTVEYRDVYDVDLIHGDWRIRYNGTRVVTTSTKSEDASTVDLGDGNDVLWLGASDRIGEDPKNPYAGRGLLVSDIRGGSGYDVLVLDNYASWSEFINSNLVESLSDIRSDLESVYPELSDSEIDEILKPELSNTDTNQSNYVKEFELIIFSADEDGNRAHCEWGSCS